jgi:hypothetical protein
MMFLIDAYYFYVFCIFASRNQVLGCMSILITKVCTSNKVVIF